MKKCKKAKLERLQLLSINVAEYQSDAERIPLVKNSPQQPEKHYQQHQQQQQPKKKRKANQKNFLIFVWELHVLL